MVSRVLACFRYPRRRKAKACAFTLAVILLLTLLSGWIPCYAQTETVLHAFDGPPSGGANGYHPVGGLVKGLDGNFYGTTWHGGTNSTGTVFQVSPSGAFTILHQFSGSITSSDGAYPYGGLTLGNDGGFYGTTFAGGAYGKGTIYRITSGGDFVPLHSFNPGNNEGQQAGTLTLGSDGNFYGVTESGGDFNNGTIFQITPSGAFTTLHSLAAYDYTSQSYPEGLSPLGTLAEGCDGSFYGTTAWGGGSGNGAGTVFKITTSGAYSVLYAFDPSNGMDGETPVGGMVQSANGSFYGTCSQGGAYYDGTVFKITSGGAETTVHAFNGSDGFDPAASLIRGIDGNLYGTTAGASENGNIFQIAPNDTVTSIYTFPGSPKGSGPTGSFWQDANGAFYGTTEYGGTYGVGEVYAVQVSIPTPVLKSLSPASIDAGGPAFTLLVKGSSFANNSLVNWNASPLTTTYVSATELKAAVPASLIASPGAAHVTVATPGGGASTAKTFTILVTTLKMLSASLTKNSTTGVYTANISLKNSGYLAANNVKITKATLGLAATSSVLPVNVGSIAAGSLGSASLSFPGSAGSSGTSVFLKVSATFTGGKFSGSLRVTLPQ
ncbi:MAG TPA: choice-of-anchor tandem repeat GloVer-containing protein [Chthonomonadaceae bacterium]|nr:choice-of-anchor tandem repeat GloVer-containing protein [Chthonomonadaceae bacterium]